LGWEAIEQQDLAQRIKGQEVARIVASADTPMVMVQRLIEALKQGGATASLSFHQWSGPEEPQPKADAANEREIKIFHLKNRPALDIANLLQTLYPAEGATFVAEPTSNTLIVRGPASFLPQVEALVLALDQEAPRQREVYGGLPLGPSLPPPATQQDGGAPRSHSFNDLDSGALANLRDEYTRLDRKTASLAAQFRQLEPDRPSAVERKIRQPRLDELKQQLRSRVEAAFEARQKLQQAELTELRGRLARIEKSIAARQRLKEQIVDDRVKELLDPNLRWDLTTPATTGAPSALNPLATAPPASGQALVVYPTAPADSDTVLQVLRTLLGDDSGVRLTVDPKTGHLIALASSSQHATIRETLRALQADSLKLTFPPPPAAAADATATSIPAAAPSGASPFSPRASQPAGGLILRSAEEFARRLSEAEAEVKHRPKLVERGYASAAQLEAAESRLKALQAEYAAQLRLLQLELESAKLASDSASRDLERATRLNQSGAISSEELDRLKLAADQARVRVEQIETLYDLYRQAGKSNPGEPEGGTIDEAAAPTSPSAPTPNEPLEPTSP
jgi:hypothetical protein